MSASLREVSLHLDAACPRCDSGPHPVDVVARVGPGTMLFAGRQPAPTALLGVASLVCPVSGEPYELTVRVPAEQGERLSSLSVVPRSDAPAPAPDEPAPASAGGHDDVAELRRSSAQAARDAAGKLLGAGTAAVAAYFTVLRFVAGDHLAGWRLAVAVVPALGYAAVTVLAALAARPVLLSVGGAADLERQRDVLLGRLDRLLRAAVAVFAGATVASAVVYLLVWP